MLMENPPATDLNQKRFLCSINVILYCFEAFMNIWGERIDDE